MDVFLIQMVGQFYQPLYGDTLARREESGLIQLANCREEMSALQSGSAILSGGVKKMPIPGQFFPVPSHPPKGLKNPIDIKEGAS